MTLVEWDAYIASASTFADAQDRMGEAIAAGVDFAALLRCQKARA